MDNQLTGPGHSVAPGICMSTTFCGTPEELERRFLALLGKLRLDEGECPYTYARFGTPNHDSVQRALLKPEPGAVASLVVASGMSAIFTPAFTLLKPGDVVIYTNPVYGCTDELFRSDFKRWGVEAVAVDTSDLRTFAAAVEIYKDRLAMVIVETPSNPIIRLSDIAGIVKIVRAAESGHRIFVMVDNTFLGIYQPAFKHGPDLVVHSATKFFGGHSDLLGGVIYAKDLELMARICGCKNRTGPVMSSLACWQLERSLETLSMRMHQAAQSAQEIAQVLAGSDLVEAVYYPGLLTEESDPEQYRVYKKQCTGPGSMISFVMRGGKEVAFRFQGALKRIRVAVSLGGTHSLSEHPATTSHAGVPVELREAAGISDGLLRISVGTEEADEPGVLVDDVKQALAASV